MNPFPERGRLRMKFSAGEQSEFIQFRMKRLKTAHVCRHQVNGGVEESFIKRIQAASLNQQGAYFLQSQNTVWSRVNAFAVGNRRTRVQRCSRGTPVILVQVLMHRGNRQKT